MCGYKNDNITLYDHEWQCPQCKSNHDRDINAAKNVLTAVPLERREVKPRRENIRRFSKRKNAVLDETLEKVLMNNQ